MTYGFGRGRNNNRGAGFAFHGSSPSWPYIGRGRGGLPRCQCPTVTSDPRAATSVTREQELDALKEQSEAMKSELSQTESRISGLETAE